MTMFPVGSAFHGGGSCGLISRLDQGYDCNLLGSSSDHHHLVIINNNNPSVMAEEESRTPSSLNDAAASSSRDNIPDEKHDQGWLQLSIGSGGGGGLLTNNGNKSTKFEIDEPKVSSHETARQIDRGLIELDLLPPGGIPASPLPQPPPPMAVHQQNIMMSIPNFNSPYSFFQVNPAAAMGISSGGGINFPHSHPQEIQWAFRPNIFPPNSSTSLSSPSSSSPSRMPGIGSYFGRPVPVQMAAGVDLGGGGGSSYSSDNIRVVNPPRRPHSGIWFMLQASKNQAREPFLAQIPKSFLRIKDGGMNVRLLMKYLVNKLRLDNESEIEIRCRGQQLLPYLTLQHVRDNIWSQRVAFSPSSLFPSPNSSISSSTSTIDHLMVLHYGRSAS